MSGQFQAPNWFSSLLKPGEQLLWQGRPKPAGLVKIIGPVFLFLVFLAFIIFLGWGAYQERGTTPGTSHMILALILLGADLLFLYFAVVVFPRKRRTMQYLITDQRILIKSRGFIENLKSYDLARIVSWEQQKKSDGSGEIYFASFDIDNVDPEAPMPEDAFEDVLFGLENVDQVWIILQDAANQAKKPS